MVKNLFLGQERSWWRKSREGLMSVMLEARYPKQRILEVYLNEVYLGQRGSVSICGVQAAARFYLGRDLDRLSLGESALIAGLIRSPGLYNPFAHPDRAVARRDQVLEAMGKLGMASSEEVEAARAERLHLGSGSGGFGAATHVVDFVRAQLQEYYTEQNIEGDGLPSHESKPLQAPASSADTGPRGWKARPSVAASRRSAPRGAGSHPDRRWRGDGHDRGRGLPQSQFNPRRRRDGSPVLLKRRLARASSKPGKACEV